MPLPFFLAAPFIHMYQSDLQLEPDGQIVQGNLMFSLATEGQDSSRGPTTRSCSVLQRYARIPFIDFRR